jgi:hypothetical protein
VIILLWLVVNSYVLWRDWQPSWTGEGPPPLAIDLVDEAAQAVPIRWTLYRGESPIGRLTTQMHYEDAHDTFAFTHTYRRLQWSSMGVHVEVPTLEMRLRVNRLGDLLEQQLTGDIEVRGLGLVVSAQARVRGEAIAGQWHTLVEWSSPWGSQQRQLPVRSWSRGQPLNPLLPLNRLTNLRPGRRWLVQQDNPLESVLREWLQSLAADYGLQLSVPVAQPLLAEILRETQPLHWGDTLVTCWVIEYRRQEELVARTYVHSGDGRVLLQEVFGYGEHVRLIRDP